MSTYSCQHTPLSSCQHTLICPYVNVPLSSYKDTSVPVLTYLFSHIKIPLFLCQHSSLVTSRYLCSCVSIPLSSHQDTFVPVSAYLSSHQDTFVPVSAYLSRHIKIPLFLCQHTSLVISRYLCPHDNVSLSPPPPPPPSLSPCITSHNTRPYTSVSEKTPPNTTV